MGHIVVLLFKNRIVDFRLVDLIPGQIFQVPPDCLIDDTLAEIDAILCSRFAEPEILAEKGGIVGRLPVYGDRPRRVD
jgi:hypothetical protein